MRRVSLFTHLLAVLTVISLFGAQPARANWDDDDRHGKRFSTLTGRAPRIIGHRGSPGFDGENTLRGFRRAVELGADGIELDLLFTSDDKLIVGHDWELSRLIGEEQLTDMFPGKCTIEDGECRWFTRDFTQDELQTLKVTFPAPGTARLDYGSISDDYRMPTYEEVLDLFKELRRKNRGLKLYTELKTDTRWTSDAEIENMVGQVVDALVDAGMSNDRRNHWIQSFDAFAMELFASNPEIKKLKKSLLVGSDPGFSVGPHPVNVPLNDLQNERDVRQFIIDNVVSRNLQILHGWKVAWFNLMGTKGIDLARIAHDFGIELHAFTFRDPRFFSDYKNSPAVVGGDFEGYRSAVRELQFFYKQGVDAVLHDYVVSGREALKLLGAKMKADEDDDQDNRMWRRR